jgi:hypothetical protein
MVATDAQGDYQEVYSPITDPQITEYLSLREQVGHKSPLQSGLWKRKLRAATLPFTPNLTDPEFLPSQCVQFFKVLRQYFPRHRLCLSDFSALPESIGGIDAPVVQTRYQGMMIPCSTYLVQPGWFDIFFPTNFELMEKIYSTLIPSSHTQVQLSFLSNSGLFAGPNATQVPGAVFQADSAH